MALFLEWGEGKGLVLHRRTTPGPLWRVSLKSSVAGSMALFFEWGEGKGHVLHRRTTPGPLWKV